MPLISSICFLLFFFCLFFSTSFSSSSSPLSSLHHLLLLGLLLITIILFSLLFISIFRFFSNSLFLYVSRISYYTTPFSPPIIPFKSRPTILCYSVREPIHIQATIFSIEIQPLQISKYNLCKYLNTTSANI